jgi:uncharacterized protein involved in type VI secretion and phage assembly
MTDDDVRRILEERVLSRFYGKYEAVVTDNADPSEIGRVRARVPAVLGTEVETGWALPCAPFGGGKDRGLLAVPEVGDTIWIEFAGGDVSRPIWTGAFWGAPESSGGADDLGEATGSEVPTTDGSERAGPGRLVLRTASGHRFFCDDEAGVIVLITADDGAAVRIDKSGEVTITASTIKLGADADQKLVLGDKLQQLFNQHTHPTGVGPSGPPTQAMGADHLSQVSKTE